MGGRDRRNELVITVTVSLFAVMMTLILVIVFTIPCKKWWLKRQKEAVSKWSFYATETEPRAWDSLSFSQSTTDLSISKFQSWESLSDDSCINTLDEVISQRASIMKANSKRNCEVISKLHLPQTQRVSVIPDPTITLSQR